MAETVSQTGEIDFKLRFWEEIDMSVKLDSTPFNLDKDQIKWMKRTFFCNGLRGKDRPAFYPSLSDITLEIIEHFTKDKVGLVAFCVSIKNSF